LKPISRKAARKERGPISSRIVPSLKFSGVENGPSAYLTVRRYWCNKSAIRKKHCSAISSMRSSSLISPSSDSNLFTFEPSLPFCLSYHFLIPLPL